LVIKVKFIIYIVHFRYLKIPDKVFIMCTRKWTNFFCLTALQILYDTLHDLHIYIR